MKTTDTGRRAVRRFGPAGAARLVRQVLVLTGVALLAPGLAAGASGPLALGAASSYAILAGSGITIAGSVNSTAITGDIGTHPTPAITGLGNVVLNGVNHADDAVTQTAKNDLVTAYNEAAGRGPVITIGTELGGTTRAPGIYDSADGTFAITGVLTLDGQGDPDAVFIFRASTTLITAGSSRVTLAGCANAANIYWLVGSSATLGASSSLTGTILAQQSITVLTGATVEGRALALNGAVTLDTNTFFPARLGDVWCDAVPLGNNWYWVDWFGYFYDFEDGWIYHLEHGFMFVVGDPDFWTTDMGWMWSDRDAYPFFYRYADQTWLFYAKGSDHPRWFFNYRTNMWEAH